MTNLSSNADIVKKVLDAVFPDTQVTVAMLCLLAINRLITNNGTTLLGETVPVSDAEQLVNIPVHLMTGIPCVQIVVTDITTRAVIEPHVAGELMQQMLKVLACDLTQVEQKDPTLKVLGITHNMLARLAKRLMGYKGVQAKRHRQAEKESKKAVKDKQKAD